jgi:translation initiation factor IF-3
MTVRLRGGCIRPDFLFKNWKGILSQLPRGGAVENRRFRINQFIRVPEVRLVDSDGTMVGVVKTSEALMKAKEQELDLVEISPQANPPVCRIINFSKFKYEMEKKEKEAKKKQKNSHIKEIRIRPRIGDHDLEVKIKHAREFIVAGDKVQLTAIFSGREMQHKDLGMKIMDKIKESLTDVAEPEGRTSSMGTRVFMTLAPKKSLK